MRKSTKVILISLLAFIGIMIPVFVIAGQTEQVSDTMLGATSNTTITVCSWDMPCGPTTTIKELEEAYNLCQSNFQRQLCDGSICWTVGSNTDSQAMKPLGGGSQYTVPACDDVTKRWLSSQWKKDEEQEEKDNEKHALERAKSFVEAVSKQKPGKGESK